MKKIINIILVAVLLFLATAILLLYSRSSDYRARFDVNTTPDVAYFHILNWDTWNRKIAGTNIIVTEKDPVSHISHEIVLKDTTLIFNWEFSPVNDSVTMVRVRVSDPDRKLFNRITAPFLNTPFKTGTRKNLLDIQLRMNLLLKTFHFEFTGLDRFKECSCVYVSFNSTARGKAGAMLSNVVALNQFVRQNNLELNGNPFLIVHDWNSRKDSLIFDFCFPVGQTETIPEHPFIRFKTVEGMEAVKADFYGNYSISDISWLNLSEEANSLGYNSNHTLIEVYDNDPHSGGNDLEWKAEIYLGINRK